MEILITQSSRTDAYSSVELSDGKQRVFVGRGASGAITVCNLNASHRVWRKGGRTFWSFEDAAGAYKSEFMRASITLAQAYLC